MARYTEIPRDEYERRALATLRKELLEGSPLIEREGRFSVEDVRLETSGSPHRVHVLFREAARPGCLFGFWASAVEELSADPVVLDAQKGYWGPEEWASTIVVTHFEEQLEAIDLGLPPDCDPEGITWVNGYRRLPPERARGNEPDPYSRAPEQGEIDRIYDEWGEKTGGICDAFERRGWDVFWSVGYSVAGSDRLGRDDFTYHIIAYRPVIESVSRGGEPVFELFDEERKVVAYSRSVPTPAKAAELLEGYGVPLWEGDVIRARLPRTPYRMVPRE